MSRKQWHSRGRRLEQRFYHLANDIGRSFSWNLFGGRIFFPRYESELLNGHRWCFIVGCNNSGTSLLQRVLDTVSEVSTFHHEGQRYTRALKRAEKRGHERVWFEYVDELRMAHDCKRDLLPRLLHDWMRELDEPIRDTILEKTTANAVRMRWLQAVFPKSHFIGVVRNGYAVSEGIRRKGNKSVLRGARHWSNVNKVLLEDAKYIQKFTLVKYEELVEDPWDVARRLCGFLDLSILKSSSEIDSIHENEFSQIRNMNSESIQRLNRQDIEWIHAEAHEMLDYFRYSPDGVT